MTNYQAKLYSAEGQEYAGKIVHTFNTKVSKVEVYYNAKQDKLSTFETATSPKLYVQALGYMVVGSLLKLVPIKEVKQVGSDFLAVKFGFKSFITINDGRRIQSARGGSFIKGYSELQEKTYKNKY